MKKILLLSLVAVLASFTTYSQQKAVFWSEDFERDWSVNWHVEAGTWEVGTPTSGPGKDFAGSQCAATVLAGNYVANVSARLIRHTSFVVPSADQNPRLRFWHWYHIASGDQASVQIKVGSGDWQTISDTYTYTGSAAWTRPTIDLKTFAGATVQLALYFKSNTDLSANPGWFVDDLTIVTGKEIFNTSETWESGLGDWSVDKGTWEVGSPTSGPGKAYTGTKCAATVFAGSYHANVASRLISPPFTIPGADQNPRIRFWQWYSMIDGDQAAVQIKIAGEDWQTISGPFTNTSGNVWFQAFLDLSAFANKKAQLAFYFTSDNNLSASAGWYIDDISFENITWVKESEVQKINIYPNPFSEKTTIQFDDTDLSGYRLSVYNISGTKVLEMKDIRSHKIELEKGSLPAGIYIIELKGAKVYRNKIIIR